MHTERIKHYVLRGREEDERMSHFHISFKRLNKLQRHSELFICSDEKQYQQTDWPLPAGHSRYPLKPTWCYRRSQRTAVRTGKMTDRGYRLRTERAKSPPVLECSASVIYQQGRVVPRLKAVPAQIHYWVLWFSLVFQASQSHPSVGCLEDGQASRPHAGSPQTGTRSPGWQTGEPANQRGKEDGQIKERKEYSLDVYSCTSLCKLQFRCCIYFFQVNVSKHSYNIQCKQLALSSDHVLPS